MSEFKTFSTSLAEDGSAIVCRDFLRNVCERGAKCKFHHPETSDSVIMKAEASLQDKILFCHDFQNSKCSRSSCKFLHCSREVENEYQQSGYLPPYVREQVIQLGMSADGPANVGRVPVCKDNLANKCLRGNRCKFRHVSSRDYDIELGSGNRGYANFGVVSAINEFPSPTQLSVQMSIGGGGGGGGACVENLGHANPMKRRMVEPVVAGGLDVSGQETLLYLQQENHHLRLQLQEMERKITELSTTNDFLLEQNTKLRLGGAPPHPHMQPRPW